MASMVFWWETAPRLLTQQQSWRAEENKIIVWAGVWQEHRPGMSKKWVIAAHLLMRVKAAIWKNCETISLHKG